MIRILLAASAFLALAACITPEQQAAMVAAQAQADAQECQSLGFRAGTDAFGNCILKLRAIRAQEENTRAINTAADWTWGPPYGRFGRHPYWW